jgi:hypothetical protein
MKKTSVHPRAITTAKQALIIQRVIVDGWTIDTAAAHFNMPERLIAAWVAGYRRHGMASLRDPSTPTLGSEFIHTILRPVRAVSRRIWQALRRPFVIDAPAEPVPLRRSNKDGPS